LQDAKGRQIINTYVPFGEAPEFTGNPESVQQILTTKAPAVSDLFTSLAVKRPVYNISIPIQKGDDIHYILSLGLLPEILAQILRDQQFDATWVSTIWDRKGILMARSRDHERLLGTHAEVRVAALVPAARARHAAQRRPAGVTTGPFWITVLGRAAGCGSRTARGPR